ncbi:MULTISPECIES: cadmium resistance transporter [Cyanophyceae]|uniref:Cadmium resistance transporter n=1 Tax=Leptolyngbya subtilissima DQ-A4 TaxID=2933933 RepID=A0ABV0KAZ7_9CYAN|nr:cadmium resistance transporter [Nodosilinea sp. FACHB-141]MBD2111849.1 cadmium resistance transporter [Nodosilinea sp. FACHB-141]
MPSLSQTLVKAAIAFVATNLDDFVLLMVFFSQVPNRFSHRQIFWGRYLGFAALVVLSLPGFFGGLVLPKAYVGLLGLVPIAIGLRQLFRREDGAEEQVVPPKLPLLNAQMAAIAGITLANGGDNIGIYVSLFVGQTWAELGVTLLVFGVLVALWYWLARGLVGQPGVRDRLTVVGHRLMPLVLIGLGLFILVDSGTYRLIGR